jgi:hypothetical protein
MLQRYEKLWDYKPVEIKMFTNCPEKHEMNLQEVYELPTEVEGGEVPPL